MIKPNEVRRKNLVEYDERVFEIDIIAEEFPTLNTTEFGVGVVDWNNIRPIPLSEEWLLTFGFTMVNMGGWKYKNFEIDNITTEDHYETEFKLTLGDWVLKPLKYVHELQNYFFALYSEELTIKI